ncbi:MAG TPA: RNA-binding cell elongation regulator Jag/EloR [bacterium]|nr:RNA-binding cell elongation regulator Jag/EloR [bacterium]
MKEVLQDGRTREEALKLALETLGATEEQVDIEVVEAQKERLFGLIGARHVKLRVSLKKGIETQKSVLPNDLPVDDFEEEPQPAALLFNDETPEEIVENFLTQVFESLEVKCDLDIHEGEKNIFVDIGGDDSGIIIGKFGQTLDAIQFLTNVIMSKKHGNKKKILINVGDYRQRRETSITKMAKSVARKVIKSKKDEALAPMPPQDRRIVHLALANFDHISTSSEGSGKNRKVIIAYKD